MRTRVDFQERNVRVKMIFVLSKIKTINKNKSKKRTQKIVFYAHLYYKSRSIL